jgi:hypothetical protein
MASRTERAATPEPTGDEQKPGHLYKPGQSGNPAGRPKGSRNKLGEAFITALHDDFQEHGVAVIAKVRDERPHEYLKVVASLLPKQVEIKETAFDGIPDEQLAAIVAAARDALGVRDGGGEGAVH